MALDPKQLNALMSTLRAQNQKLAQHDQVLQNLLGLMKSQADAPKWIEEIPGRRVPYFAPVDLTIAADSASRVEGTHSVSSDGPFICTGVAGFFRKTSGAYQGTWGPISSLNARIASGTTGQQHGYQFIFDHPSMISGDLEIIDRGSDRNWQHSAVATGLYAPQAGGAYILPIANLFDRNSVILVAFTPRPSVPYTGVVQIILLGYKIVQGNAYQP